MFDCTITIKGDGQGRNGRFKQDKTDAVSRFMVDNVYLYTQVKQHVVQCRRCDPTEALRHYLNRRLTLDKFQPRPGKTWPLAGTVTGSLARLALSYERLCAKTRPIPKKLVDEFIWRSADPRIVCPNEHRLTIGELVASAELSMTVFSMHQVPASFKFGKICMLLQNQVRPETEQEMEDLVSVMEIQCV